MLTAAQGLFYEGLFSLHLLHPFGNCQTNKPKNDDLHLLFLSTSPFSQGENREVLLSSTGGVYQGARPWSSPWQLQPQQSCGNNGSGAQLCFLVQKYRITALQAAAHPHSRRRTGNLSTQRQQVEVPILADQRRGPERM